MLELEPLFFLSAFFAGVLMFLAPCTLPLLPAYLGFISGVTEKELQNPDTKKRAQRNVVKNSILFTTGFSLVLVGAGMSASFLGSLVPKNIVSTFTLLGGMLIVVFGLFMMGIIRMSFLTRERRLKIPRFLSVGSPVSSFLLGSAFAIGWTPCIGPVYGTILIYASSTETVFQGFILLALFALGFSLPLVGMAFAISQASRFVERSAPYLHTLSFVGGCALVIVGLSTVLGNTVLTNWFFYLFEYLDLGDVLLPYL